MNDKEALKLLGARDEVLDELLDYTKNRFILPKNIPKEMEDEEFIAFWQEIIDLSKKIGLEKALNRKMPHGDTDISFKNPNSLKIEMYKSIAGSIPIIYATETEDFEELITKLIHKGEKKKGLERTGAAFAFSKSNKFIILSNKPYSNIPAKEINIDEEKWKSMSLILRREHECTHYFTKRFLKNSSINLHDELVADFAGIFSCADNFYSDWFLRGLGLIKNSVLEDKGRFMVYVPNLSNEASELMKKIIKKVSKNAEKWSNTSEVKNMSLQEKTLYLCKLSLLDWYHKY